MPQRRPVNPTQDADYGVTCPQTIAEVIPPGSGSASKSRRNKYSDAVDANARMTCTHPRLGNKHFFFGFFSHFFPFWDDQNAARRLRRCSLSYLEVEAGGGPRHQVVEVLVEILAEDILRHGLVGVKRLLLSPRRQR